MGAGIAPVQVRDQAGFSLIELLITVAVLSVLAVGVTVSVGRGSAGSDSDMAVFQRSYDMMRSLSVHGRETRGLVLSTRGVRFARLAPDGWQVSDIERKWQGRMVLAVDGPIGASGAPEVLFLSNGQTSAFQVTFSTRAGAAPIRCATDGWAGLSCTKG